MNLMNHLMWLGISNIMLGRHLVFWFSLVGRYVGFSCPGGSSKRVSSNCRFAYKRRFTSMKPLILIAPEASW